MFSDEGPSLDMSNAVSTCKGTPHLHHANKTGWRLGHLQTVCSTATAGTALQSHHPVSVLHKKLMSGLQLLQTTGRMKAPSSGHQITCNLQGSLLHCLGQKPVGVSFIPHIDDYAV